MSKAALSGGATGTGTVTILAPSTNVNRTITLPDADGIAVAEDINGEIAQLPAGAAAAAAGSVLNQAGVWAVPAKPENDIINGRFLIAQTGTSFVAPAAAAYDLDGWLNGKVGTAVFDITRAAGTIAGEFLRLSTVTTADVAFAAGDYVEHLTRVEGYNAVKYIGNTFTIGFKVKSAVTGIHCLAIYDGTSTQVKEYTINVANTEEYKTITFTGGLQALNSTTNAWGVEIRWSNGQGTTFTTTADVWNAGNFIGTANQVNDVATVGNVFGIGAVTMNLGTTVAPDTATYEQDLAWCQRYFGSSYSVGVVPGTVSASGCIGINGRLGATQHFSLAFPVSMRAAPTIILYSPITGAVGKIRDDTAAADATSNTGRQGTSGFSALTSVSPTPAAGALLRFQYTAEARL